MSKNGPILIIEDDLDDQQTLETALTEAGVINELIFFDNGPDAIEYLRTTTQQPFLMFCDVNLPKQDGIEFKRELDNDPEMRARCIPFIFYSTHVSHYAVNEAFRNLTVQGFFQKNNTYRELKDVVKTIIDYWRMCKLPSSLTPTEVKK
ncbi:MAG: response regulator [Ferruginibacter sp.]